MFYGNSNKGETSGPVNARTLGLALGIHVALFLVFWLLGKLFFPEPEVVVPIDMTIVPPWAEQDPNDPAPDPNPPVEPTPPKPTQKKAPEIEPPKLKEQEDAVERIIQKPNKEFKKGELKKKEDPKPEKPKHREFVRTGRLVKNPPKVKLPPGKGTSRDKPLSMAEIQKALAAGARFGASNQLAASEEQRCVSLISRRFYEVWDVPGGYDGKVVLLTIRFSAGGIISGYSIAKSSGIPALDASVLAAAKRAHHVNGLSADFLTRYPEITISMRPDSE